jgi:hypothetical protein
LHLPVTYLLRELRFRLAARSRVRAGSALISASDKTAVLRERASKITLDRPFGTDLDGGESSWSRYCACARHGRLYGFFDYLSRSVSRSLDRYGIQNRADVGESVLIDVRQRVYKHNR